MAKLYSWTTFRTKVDETSGVPVETVGPGEEVSASKLNVTEEQFKELQDIGAVRETPYPPAGQTEAPSDYYRGLMARIGQGEVNDQTVKELKDAGLFFDSTAVEEPPEIATAGGSK